MAVIGFSLLSERVRFVLVGLSMGSMMPCFALVCFMLVSCVLVLFILALSILNVCEEEENKNARSDGGFRRNKQILGMYKWNHPMGMTHIVLSSS